MEITAPMVKDLRQRTGVGMMECKKALIATQGNIELAIENMRKAGIAQADKRSDRVASEGVVLCQLDDSGQQALLLEVNSETDFVSRSKDFKNFAMQVAKQSLALAPRDMDALQQLPYDSSAVTIDSQRRGLISRIRENIRIRRFCHYRCQGDHLGFYLHGDRIGVIVDVAGGDAELARNLAMHIAASHPLCLSDADAPSEELEKERRILTDQAEKSGKPKEIIEKMVAGRIKKYLHQIALLHQPFVKDPDCSIEKLLSESHATVLRFVRFELGEGLQRQQEDFATAVAAQAKGS